jgi:hypothetical protein
MLAVKKENGQSNEVGDSPAAVAFDGTSSSSATRTTVDGKVILARVSQRDARRSMMTAKMTWGSCWDCRLKELDREECGERDGKSRQARYKNRGATS